MRNACWRVAAQRYPRVRINLQIGNWQELRSSLLDDAVELFVADSRELLADPLLCIEPLQRHSGVLFCRPNHPLLQQPALRMHDLLDYPLAGTQLPQTVEQNLRALSNREQPLSIQCDNFMVLKALVADSDVLSMAPWDVVAEDIHAGRLAQLPLEAGALTEQSPPRCAS